MPDEDREDSEYQPGLEKLISLKVAAELSGLSPSRLRYLVNSGEMWGIKPGRNWLTTEQAVNGYVARDRRPGPKSKKGSESQQ